MRKRIECHKKDSHEKQPNPWTEKLKIVTVVLNFIYTVYRIVKEILS